MSAFKKFSIFLIFIFLLAGAVPVAASDLTSPTGSIIISDSGVIEVRNPGESMASTLSEPFNSFMERYRFWITGFSGIATLVLVAVLVYRITKLSGSGANPMERQKAIKGIIISGVGIALMGSLSFFCGILWNLIS